MSIVITNLTNESIPLASVNYTLKAFETKRIYNKLITGELRLLDTQKKVQVELDLTDTVDYIKESLNYQTLRVAIVGDSIGEATENGTHYPIADDQLIAGRGLASLTGVWTGFGQFNQVSTFLVFARQVGGTVASPHPNNYILEWDGVKNVRATLVGDSVPGPWKDVTGGGFFLLQTTSGAVVYITLRWRHRPPNAVTSLATTTNGLAVRASGGLHGFATHIMYKTGLGRQFANFSIQGDQTQDILARSQQVLDWKPNLIILMCGINDAINITFSATTTAMGLLWDKLRSEGAELLVGTTYPVGNDASFATYNQSFRLAVSRLRKWQIDNAIANPQNLELIDVHPLLTNRSTAFGGVISAYYKADKLHLIEAGASVAAKPWIDAIQRRFGRANLPVSDAGPMDIYDATDNPRGNLLGTTGQFQGTGGTSGSGVVGGGSIPTGINVGRVAGTTIQCLPKAPGDAAPVARTDGKPGNWFSCFIDGATANNETIYINTVPVITVGGANPIQVGSKVVFSGVMKLSGITNLRELRIEYGQPAVGANYGYSIWLSSGDTVWTQTDPETFEFTTGELLIAAGTVYWGLRVGTNIGGSVTVQMQDFSMKFL